MLIHASSDVGRRSGCADPATAAHLLRHALDVAATTPAGRPTRDVPALAETDPDACGIAFADLEGAVCVGAGEWLRPFSLQSVSKVFALALLLATERDDAWALFAVPGNEDHRSAAALDPREGGAPGPFTNAGAMVVVDRLMDHHPDVAAAVAALVAAEALGYEPLTSTRVDEDVARGELAVSHRNRGLAHLLAERGLLRHPVESVLEQYIRQCAVAATCRAVALAGGVLARDGVRRDGRALLDRRQARRLNALMLTSGAYADSGRYAVQVGLPLKTGVGGGVLAVVPGRGALCAWSPGLDDVGTPLRALAAVAHVAEASDLSVF